MGTLLTNLATRTLTCRPPSTVTVEQLVAAILEEIPDAESALQGATGGAPGGAVATNSYGLFEHAGPDPYFAGLRITTQFHQEPRGFEAQVESSVESTPWDRTEAILVPERGSSWTPQQWVTYRVELTRKISKGRRQIWLVRPICAAEDERWKAVIHAARQVERSLYRHLEPMERADAQAWALQHLPALGLRPMPIPECPRFEDVGEIHWKWIFSEKENFGGRYGHPSVRTTGTATATWRGVTGTYTRTTTVVWVREEYESPDGGRRYDEGSRMGQEDNTFLNGDDAVAAHRKAMQEYEAAATASFQADGSRSAAVHWAMKDLLKSIPGEIGHEGSPRYRALYALATRLVNGEC